MGNAVTRPIPTMRKILTGDSGLHHRAAHAPAAIFPISPAIDTKELADLEKKLANLITEEAAIKARYDTEALAIQTSFNATLTMIEAEGRELDKLIAKTKLTTAKLNEYLTDTLSKIIDLVSSYPEVVKQDFIYQIIQEILSATPEKHPEISDIKDFDKYDLLTTFLKTPQVKGHLDSISYDDSSSSNLIETLFKTNNVNLSKAAINALKDINAKDIKGYTTLHYAIQTGQLPIISACLEAGGNITIDFPDNRSCGYKIAFHCNLDTVEILTTTSLAFEPEMLEAACLSGRNNTFDWAYSKINNCNYVFKNGATPLIAAMSNGFAYGIDRLIAAGADVNKISASGDSPLLWAAKINCLDYAKELSDRGANILTSDSEGNNILHHFIASSKFKLIRVTKNISFFEKTLLLGVQPLKEVKIITPNGLVAIVGAGGEISLEGNTFGIGARRDFDLSALRSPAANFDYALEAVKFFTERGLSINIQNKHGLTPFMLACGMQLMYLANQLVDRFELDYSIIDKEGYAPLRWALELRDKSIIEKIIAKGANINHQDKHGNTALFWAARYQLFEIVDLLVNKYNAEDLPGNQGNTAWDIATATLNQELIDILAPKKSIDPEVLKLWIAVKKADMSTIELQIEKGVPLDSTIGNNLQTTPLIEAINLRNLSIIKLLVDKGANINYPDKQQVPPLYYSLGYNGQPINSDIVKFLVSIGANVMQAVYDGDTPLHMAGYRACIGAMKILITHGATVDVTNSEGKTPLHVLIEKEGLEPTQKLTAVKYLLCQSASPTLKDNEGHDAIGKAKSCFSEATYILEHPDTLPPLNDFEASIAGELAAWQEL